MNAKSNNNFKQSGRCEKSKGRKKTNSIISENNNKILMNNVFTFFYDVDKENKEPENNFLESKKADADNLAINPSEQKENLNIKNRMVAFGRKVKLTKESVRRYQVTVCYVQVSDEVRKIKRAIIENIMKKNDKK